MQYEELILQRIDDLRVDIKDLFTKLDEKQSAIEKMTREIQDIQTKSSHCQASFDKEFQNVWLAINSLRNKPEQTRVAMRDVVSILTGMTGWIILILTKFGVL